MMERTHLPIDCMTARSVRAGRAAAWLAVRWRRSWLRHLSVLLLLITASAMLLQPLAHARPGVHSGHQDAAMAQLCAYPHASDGERTRTIHCGTDTSGHSLTDCCQACVIVALAPEIQPLPGPSGVGHPARVNPDHNGRSPPGVLKPPRPVVVV